MLKGFVVPAKQLQCSQNVGVQGGQGQRAWELISAECLPCTAVLAEVARVLFGLSIV